MLASGDVSTHCLSPSTCLHVGVFACDKAPHCCSDVSLLCPPSHDRHTQTTGPLLREQDVRASPLVSPLPTVCPSDSGLPIPQLVRLAELSRGSLTAIDQCLQFGDVNRTLEVHLSAQTVLQVMFCGLIINI